MFKLFTSRSIAGVVAAIGVFASTAASAGFVSFAIRGTPGIDNSTPGQTEFLITAGGQKAALGSNDVNGATLGSLIDLRITRLDDITRFPEGSGPRVGPYLNFWIKDSAGRYAVVANEPSNPEWASYMDGSLDLDFADLANKTAKIYEAQAGFDLGGVVLGDLTFADLANYVIEAPSVAALTAGWAGLGTGAPRELGTNLAYGVNWVFGDTLSNYVSGQPGYIVTGAAVAAVGEIPEPAGLALVSVALLAAGLASRRKH